ncbi:OLC1v1016168C3 [Oldenlandia corymbosa var. corymbosa]|nr:OLC1v1016168C3 [Oldenlandia corymbosa var. corymbosa]
MFMEQQQNRIVCVTGAGGFVASWLVELLLSRNYSVVGTVRDPDNEKYAHLKKLGSKENQLKLVKADFLDYRSISAAINGCHGVFHVASPVPSSSVSNPQVELIEPAVNGTHNVLKSCSESNIKRVVVVSSVGAVMMNPSWPEDQVKDESCWSDKDYCKSANIWYSYSKTVAEMLAFEYAKATGLNVITLLPSLVLGPLLQQDANASSLIVIKLMTEGCEEVENKARPTVDVRDVAEALLLLYEKPEAEGRYICTSHPCSDGELVDILRKHYPSDKYPKR